MQLLFQEFFNKIFKVINGIHIFQIRILVKIIFYILILASLGGLILFSTIKQTYIFIIGIFGLIFFAELAHLIRKSREIKVIEKITEKNKPEEKIKNEYLLKKNKPKNEVLLNPKKNEPKNKSLLK